MARDIALSVVIPSVHTRLNAFSCHAPKQLFEQFDALPERDRRRVEIISIIDTKSVVLGDKRTAMNLLAGGKYVVHVDDDDDVAPDFISEILNATDSDADLITFLVEAHINDRPPVLTHYSIKHYGAEQRGPHQSFVIPDNRMVFRRELAVQVPFPSVLCGEDVAWGKKMRPLLKTEHAINKVLYRYIYDTHKTETQGKNKYLPQDDLRKLAFEGLK